MSGVDEPRTAEMRAAFFKRTRHTALALYVSLAAAGIAAAVAAVTTDVLRGAAGFAVGLVAAALLFAASPLFKVSARAARVLVIVAAVAGAIAASVSGDIGSAVGAAAGWGAFGGFSAGSILGIATIRRRLKWDDELLLRQKRLGFEPERPYRWLRSSSKPND